MKEKILEKVSEELFLLLLRLKNVKVCSINTLLLINESLKMIKSMENSSDDREIKNFDFISNKNDIRDENFNKVFTIYNRLLWIKDNYVNAGY